MELSKYSVKHFIRSKQDIEDYNNTRLILFLKPAMHLMSKNMTYENVFNFNKNLDINLKKNIDICLQSLKDNSKTYFRNWKFVFASEHQLHLIENIAFAYEEKNGIMHDENPFASTIQKENFYAHNTEVMKQQVHFFNNIAYYLFIKGFEDSFPDAIFDKMLSKEGFPMGILPLEKIGVSNFLENMLVTLIESELQKR